MYTQYKSIVYTVYIVHNTTQENVSNRKGYDDDDDVAIYGTNLNKKKESKYV